MVGDLQPQGFRHLLNRMGNGQSLTGQDGLGPSHLQDRMGLGSYHGQDRMGLGPSHLQNGMGLSLS